MAILWGRNCQDTLLSDACQLKQKYLSIVLAIRHMMYVSESKAEPSCHQAVVMFRILRGSNLAIEAAKIGLAQRSFASTSQSRPQLLWCPLRTSGLGSDHTWCLPSRKKTTYWATKHLKHVLTRARAFTQLSASSCKVFLVSKATIALFCWFAKLKACRFTQTPTSAKIHLIIPGANWMPSSYQQASPWPFFLWALVLSFGHPVQLMQHQRWHSRGTPLIQRKVSNEFFEDLWSITQHTWRLD